MIDRVAEYAALAKAWQRYCVKHGKRATLDGFNLPGKPVGVILTAALAEPPHHSNDFTGDLIADALGGLRAFVQHLDLDASEAGGGGAWLNGYQIETLARRLDAVIALRAYERGDDVAEFNEMVEDEDGDQRGGAR